MFDKIRFADPKSESGKILAHIGDDRMRSCSGKRQKLLNRFDRGGEFDNLFDPGLLKDSDCEMLEVLGEGSEYSDGNLDQHLGYRERRNGRMAEVEAGELARMAEVEAGELARMAEVEAGELARLAEVEAGELARKVERQAGIDEEARLRVVQEQERSSLEGEKWKLAEGMRRLSQKGSGLSSFREREISQEIIDRITAIRSEAEATVRGLQSWVKKEGYGDMEQAMGYIKELYSEEKLAGPENKTFEDSAQKNIDWGKENVNIEVSAFGNGPELSDPAPVDAQLVEPVDAQPVEPILVPVEPEEKIQVTLNVDKLNHKAEEIFRELEDIGVAVDHEHADAKYIDRSLRLYSMNKDSIFATDLVRALEVELEDFYGKAPVPTALIQKNPTGRTTKDRLDLDGLRSLDGTLTKIQRPIGSDTTYFVPGLSETAKTHNKPRLSRVKSQAPRSDLNGSTENENTTEANPETPQKSPLGNFVIEKRCLGFAYVRESNVLSAQKSQNQNSGQKNSNSKNVSPFKTSSNTKMTPKKAKKRDKENKTFQG
jgi:hypothetical protein